MVQHNRQDLTTENTSNITQVQISHLKFFILCCYFCKILAQFLQLIEAVPSKLFILFQFCIHLLKLLGIKCF